MSAVTVERIEADIRQLSFADQLLLMERLAQAIRQSTALIQSTLDGQLAAMANDAEIQRELRIIEDEFAGTEADGLDAAA